MADIVIVGGGPGGYAAALYANTFDLDVVMVEKDRPGGTCLIRGCIPAKQWLHIAEVYQTVVHAAEFGVNASQPEMDWQAGLARKNQSVEGLVRGLGGLLKKAGVEVVNGFGKLFGLYGEGTKRMEKRWREADRARRNKNAAKKRGQM